MIKTLIQLLKKNSTQIQFLLKQKNMITLE